MVSYLSAKQIVENYDYCLRTARKLIDEIRQQVELGRYSEDAVLEGCGVRVSEDVFIDFLRYRRQLQDPVASKFVPIYGGYNE